MVPVGLHQPSKSFGLVTDGGKHSFQFWFQNFNIVLRSRTGLTLNNRPQTIVNSVNIGWLRGPFVLDNKSKTIVSASFLCYPCSMARHSVLWKCPQFITISRIALYMYSMYTSLMNFTSWGKKKRGGAIPFSEIDTQIITDAGFCNLGQGTKWRLVERARSFSWLKVSSTLNSFWSVKIIFLQRAIKNPFQQTAYVFEDSFSKKPTLVYSIGWDP